MTFLFLTLGLEFESIKQKLVKEHANVGNNTFQDFSPEIIIADSNVKYDMVERLGIPTLGASYFGYQLNTSREYKLKLLNTLKLKSESIENISQFIILEGWFSNGELLAHYYNISGYITKGLVVDALYKQTLRRLLPVLRKLKYTGQISLQLSIAKGRVLFHNISADLNVLSLTAMLENHNGSITNFFKAFLHKGSLIEKSQWTHATLLYSEPSMFYNNHMGKLMPAMLKHLWFYDIIRKDLDYYIGASHTFGVITSRGTTCRECTRRTGRTLNNINLCNKLYARMLNTQIDDYYIALIEQKLVKGGEIHGYKEMVFKQRSLGKLDINTGINARNS